MEANAAERLARGDRRFAALVHAAQVLSSMDTWQERVRTCLRALRAALDVPAVGFFYAGQERPVEFVEPRQPAREELTRALRAAGGARVIDVPAPAEATDEGVPVTVVDGVMVLPLVQADAVVGAIGIAKPSGALEEPERQTLAVLGGQLVGYLAHRGLVSSLTREQRTLARALARERHRIETLTRAFRPVALEAHDGFRFSVVYRPMPETESIGGDFYQIVRLGHGRLGILLGDVCGKGLGAAGIAVVSRYIGAAYARMELGPEAVLGHMNGLLGEILEPESFVTAVYGLFDSATGRLRLSLAGHLPPLWYRARGHVVAEVDAPPGYALGFFPDVVYRGSEERMEPGDTILFYTDGAVERGPAGDASETLRACLQDLGHQPEDLAIRLFEALQARDGHPLRDDCLLLTVTWDPAR